MWSCIFQWGPRQYLLFTCSSRTCHRPLKKKSLISFPWTQTCHIASLNPNLPYCLCPRECDDMWLFILVSKSREASPWLSWNTCSKITPLCDTPLRTQLQCSERLKTQEKGTFIQGSVWQSQLSVVGFGPFSANARHMNEEDSRRFEHDFFKPSQPRPQTQWNSNKLPPFALF